MVQVIFPLRCRETEWDGLLFVQVWGRFSDDLHSTIPIKRHVTMRIGADVIEWFKDRAHGRGYQSEINRVLRKAAGL